MTEKKKQQKQPLSDEILLDKIKQKADNLKEKEAYTVIDDACKLAEELLRMEDTDDRWYLMHRVWVGMLCYSASMCRAYLHAKSLGEGGEFLSYVWLLISLLGAKTLAEKLQMPDKDPGTTSWAKSRYKTGPWLQKSNHGLSTNIVGCYIQCSGLVSCPTYL